MSRKPWWVLVAFVWALAHLFGLGRQAWAEEGKSSCEEATKQHKSLEKFTVNLLSSEQKDTPSHLCIVSERSAPGSVWIEKRDGLGLTSVDSRSGNGQAVYLLDESNRRKLRDDPRDGIWRSAPARQPGCTDPRLEICQARFSLPQDGLHFIQCVKNDRPVDDDRRVLVLLVNTHTETQERTSQKLLCGVRLEGKIATFNMEVPRESKERVVGSVLGGDYAESSARVMDEKRVDLPLVRRCQEHEIALPPAAESGNATVKFFLGNETKPDADCREEINASRRFKMLLPYLLDRASRRVEVEMKNLSSRYVGSYIDFAPPPVLSLRHAAISFKWRRSCLYPGAAPLPVRHCPEARLIDSGILCAPIQSEPGPPNLCSYVCDPRRPKPDPTAPAIAFDLPARVRLSHWKHKEDIWIDEIRYGNEELSSYVPSGTLHVDVDLETWGPLASVLKRPAAKIDRIVFRGSNGDVHFFTPGKDQRVDLPNVRCGDAVTYEVRGDRLHDPRDARVENGTIRLDPLADSEQHLSFLVFGGLNLLWPTIAPGYGFGTFPSEPSLVLGGGLGYRPSGWAVASELRYAFMLGTQSYFRARGPGEQGDDISPDRTGMHRHSFELAAFWTQSKVFHFGGFAGITLSGPLLTIDQARVGGARASFRVSPSVLIKPRPRWGIEASVGAIFGEEIYRFSTDLRGDPTWTVIENLRFSFDVRLRYSP